MNRWLSLKEEQIYYEEKQKYRVYCKCGHTNTIINKRGYKLCSWCHNLVFKDKQTEFKYRLRQNIIKEKRKLNNGKED